MQIIAELANRIEFGQIGDILINRCWFSWYWFANLKLLLSWQTCPTLANSGDVGSRRRQLFRKYGSPPPPPSSPTDQNVHFPQKILWISSTVCNRNLRRWDNRSCFCLYFPETTPHIYADWTDISADDFQLALHPSGKKLLFFLDNSSKQYLDLKSLHKSINLHILKLSRNSAARLFSVHIDLWKKSATMVEGPKTFWWD